MTSTLTALAACAGARACARVRARERMRSSLSWIAMRAPARRRRIRMVRARNVDRELKRYSGAGSTRTGQS
jgi:hypothetical protein